MPYPDNRLASRCPDTRATSQIGIAWGIYQIAKCHVSNPTSNRFVVNVAWLEPKVYGSHRGIRNNHRDPVIKNQT